MSQVHLFVGPALARWVKSTADHLPRIAAHSPDGVIELMPISDGELYSFKYVNGPSTHRTKVEPAAHQFLDCLSTRPPGVRAKRRITASAMAATVQETSGFAGPREFAAFLGLTPKQNSSGGKPKLGRISKMGNRNLRKLLVVGAHAVLFHRKPHTDPLRMWAKKLIEKKPSYEGPEVNRQLLVAVNSDLSDRVNSLPTSYPVGSCDP